MRYVAESLRDDSNEEWCGVFLESFKTIPRAVNSTVVRSANPVKHGAGSVLHPGKLNNLVWNKPAKCQSLTNVKTPIVFSKFLICLFYYSFFSWPNSSEDSRGSSSDREWQWVREEDQHSHGEDLHLASIEFLRGRREGSRCVSGII